MASRQLTWIPAFAGVFLSADVARAQKVPAGSISGEVVTESEGRPLPARVWLVGAARPGAPNARGSFRFDQLPPGRYHLRATYIGFDPRDTVLTVTSGARLRVVVRLAATPVVLTEMTIREVAKPPPAKPPEPVKPSKPSKPVDCGYLFAVSARAVICTSPQMLPRATVLRDREFLGSNSLIREAAAEAVSQAGFVPERLLQLDERTWLITARDPSRPAGIGAVRIEMEETGAHDTRVRIALTSAASVSRNEQRARAEAYLTRVRRILSSR